MGLLVNEPSDAVAKMTDNFNLIRAVLGGTNAMREAGCDYLPRYEVEESADYQVRLDQSTLYPAFSETCAKMKGRAFNEPLLIDGAPSWFVDDGIEKNFDLQGRNMDNWAADVFYDGLAMGLTHCLVDSPLSVNADGSDMSEAQVKGAGLRPYAIHIVPERILGWQKDENGNLTQVRIKFTREEPGEFASDLIPQIRVYTLIEAGTPVKTGRKKTVAAEAYVSMQAYEEEETGTGRNKKTEWVPVGAPVAMNIPFIPLITFYTKRTGYMTADPPLLELAQLNVKHWQMQSAIDALQLIICVPILCIAGGDGDTAVTIGSKSAMILPIGATAQYVEHTGAAVKSGMDNLQELKSQMRDAGAKLLAPGTPGKTGGSSAAPKTATESAEESASDNSLLGMMVSDFEGYIVNVCAVIGAWRGIEDLEVTAELDPDLDASVSITDRAKVLLDSLNSGVLSDDTYIEELKKLGLLSDEITYKDELEKINKQPKLDPPLTPINPPKPGRPAVEPATPPIAAT